MNLSLEGKIAIVTGGSKGIGRATALALAQEGVDVAICARGMDDLEDAASEIRAETGRKVLAVQADMGDPDDIKNLVATTVAALGGVDILINNAVNSKAAPFMELADEDWMNHINVKVMGYVRCSREVIPHMQKRGGGRIINIGGMAARSANILTNSNGVTNSAVSNIAKNLSDQFAPDGILINCIHPGTTRTPRQTMVLERQARDANITLEESERRAVSL
ncbi:MAG: SDR family NAD(P)-dependent oxidoreductase, partial [Chloroflexi bacterium]|nr:SDR family NAD(P)-dependent oxidoreductase [Chloroflexota bacterium]